MLRINALIPTSLATAVTTANLFLNQSLPSSVRRLTRHLFLDWLKMTDKFDFEAHLKRQREWSEKTFGPDPRVNGITDHIRKELDEILADPTDLYEWIDVAILALDGAWRAGYSPKEIIAALVAKQQKNLLREWPDWRLSPDSAIEHVRDGE